MYSLRNFIYLARLWIGARISSWFLPGTVKPLAASINLTENCQARCQSCDYWKTKWHDRMTTDEAVSLINRLADSGVRYLRFTGGEPLLRKDLFEVLERANTSKFRRITLQTNGLLLKRLHKEINASPITKVSLSIDGLAATNDVIRGINGYFKAGFDGLKLIENKEIQVVTTVNQKSSAELPELVDFVQDQGYNFRYNILDNRVYFFQNSKIDDMWPDEDAVDSILDALAKKLHRPAHEVEYVRQYFTSDAVSEPACYLGFLELYIGSNGDVLSGCYSLPAMGNLFEQNLEELVSSKTYRQRAVAMLNRECPGCTCGIFTSLQAEHFVPLVAGGGRKIASAHSNLLNRPVERN